MDSVKGKALANVSSKRVMAGVACKEVGLTEPEDFAEETLQSILPGDFHVLPLDDTTRAAIRRRTDDMIGRRDPVLTDMF